MVWFWAVVVAAATMNSIWVTGEVTSVTYIITRFLQMALFMV